MKKTKKCILADLGERFKSGLCILRSPISRSRVRDVGSAAIARRQRAETSQRDDGAEAGGARKHVPGRDLE